MSTTQVFPRVLFSQIDNDWRTPPEVYQALDAEFNFTLDPCPTVSTPDGPIFNGLTISWEGYRVFCNPPYRRGEIAKWMAKAREADVAVFLVPVRTTPRWWHDYALNADEIRFFRRRLRFSGSKVNAPFDSCAVIFRRPRGVMKANRDAFSDNERLEARIAELEEALRHLHRLKDEGICMHPRCEVCRVIREVLEKP